MNLLSFKLEGLETELQSIITGLPENDSMISLEGKKGVSLMFTFAFKTRKVQKKKVCGKFKRMIKRSPEKMKHRRK